MTRKTARRRFVPALPPRGLRPKLSASQRTDLAIAHLQTLDVLASSAATTTEMWHLVEAVLLWSRVAELRDEGTTEMVAQLQMARDVVARYSSTGRVCLSDAEYETAKLGIQVMEALAERTDHATAVAAAEWASEESTRCRPEATGATETPLQAG